jgi:hypothetical protein
MREEIKTLQQIKDEVARKHGYQDFNHACASLSGSELWPEICKTWNTYNLLSLIDWLGPNSYHNGQKLQPHINGFRTGGSTKILELFTSESEAQFKPSAPDTEVEKPDSLTVFKKHAKMSWDHEWVEDHGTLNYTEFKKIYDSLHKEIAGLVSENTRRCNKINVIIAELHDANERISELS